jgi:hypothetical protein
MSEGARKVGFIQQSKNPEQQFKICEDAFGRKFAVRTDMHSLLSLIFFLLQSVPLCRLLLFPPVLLPFFAVGA